MPPNADQQGQSSPKVLVVEDEAGLRLVTTDCLENDCGFTVVEARSGDEAVEVLKANSDIRCVFTDVRMPGTLDGISLTRHVRETYPELPVIMTSGNLHPDEKVTGIPFLTKPYDIDQVATLIWALVNREPRVG